MLLLQRLYSTNIDCFVIDSSCLHLTFVAFCLLSVIRKQQLKQCNQSIVQSALDSGQILRHQYGISVTEFQTFLLAKCPWRRGARRNGCFRRLTTGMLVKLNLSQVSQLCSLRLQLAQHPRWHSQGYWYHIRTWLK